MKKIFLTSGLMMCLVMPAMAVPTNTSATFPNDELMQADYTYTNQATYENTGVYSDSVDAEANYDWELVTVNAGYYLPANSITPVECTPGNYCPGLAQQVHMDSTAQGLTACPTGFTSSTAGAITDTQCYRGCSAANMGTTITTIAHAATLAGADYYGNGKDYCNVTVCDMGYHVDNNACAANTITINWNGATAAAISANNAGTTVYGGDIRTPQSIDPSQVPAGKRFVGWKFVKQVLFDLSTLDANIDTTYDAQHMSWIPIANPGYTTTDDFGSDNTASFGLTTPGQWAVKFSYGTVRGEALCSSTSGTWGQTGTPNESGGGRYCWCKVTQYQANGSSTWQNVLSSSWSFRLDFAYASLENASSRCADGCTNSCVGGNVNGGTPFRRALYGITQ